ncbi:AraC family transcriptional regulator [Arthrobacter mobilis]|uniref:AraC family transcriptional regulator n=1 Tax=Arthrobacter mobilis TaxID=2724944 RepID=A0A7X6HEK5_9MICC|nr:AraC family transcriptional regulator [Arthrobacter mobilis]NKX54753.1 AraC family transcriptional regulator [Arthrobacter mobilis]
MAVISAADIGTWQQIAGRHFVPLRCTTPGSTFTATLSPVTLAPDVSVCRIGSGPVRVERTDRLTRRDDGDDVLLSLQLGSSGTVSQHGRTARIAPGAAALYETNRPYVLDHPHHGQDLAVLRIGRRRLGVRDRLIADACGRTLDRRVPGMAAFAGYLRGLLSEDAVSGAGTRQELGGTAADLLSMVLRSFAGLGHAGWDSDQVLLAAVHSYIREHLADPGLSVEDLARAHHVSVRKIHALFSAGGQTPAAFVRTQRLQRAAALLPARAATGQSIAAVAAACGFGDPATFNRAFTREFGCAPSRWEPGTN